jgi:DNA-binding NarL/FixJ family response regulator
LADGWSALREARWEDAQAAFSEALARRETPEALEGLSWAAWWRDDAAAVFDARERAYRLYRRAGELASAARMATWLAADELDFRGAAAVANGWLRRAHRLLDGLDPGPDHGWLAFHEGFLAHAGGDAETALEQARLTAELGRRLEVADLEMLGLALEGAVLVALGCVPEGMHCLDEATTTALEGEAQIPISIAWACCFLVGACTATRDYERASEWCDRIAAFAEKYRSRYMLGFCRSEYGEVDLWRGSWVEAEARFESARDAFARSRPAWVGGPTAGLAELRRRQGRRADAERLLEDAGSSMAAQLCRARLAMDDGNYGRAAQLLERLLRSQREGRALDRAPVLELLARAHVARGELAQAQAELDALREIEQNVGSRPLRAAVDSVAGAVAAGRGDDDQARRLHEDALDGFERSGAPFDAALVRVELALSLAALDSGDDAKAEAGQALAAFEALGAGPEAERARRVVESLDAERPGTLTPREREVVGLLAEGLTNRQIAERLVVSEHTVHRHVTNILRKLSLPSRAAAAAYAVRSGLARTGHSSAAQMAGTGEAGPAAEP